jgi:hypothetical protein
MRIDGGAHQRSEREVGPSRPKSQKIASQRRVSARQLSGMSGIFLRTGHDLRDCTGWLTSREDSNRSVSTIFGNSGRRRGHVRSSSSIRTLRQCSPNSRFVPIATERSAAKSVVIRSPRRPARAACPAPQGRAPWRSCPPATFRDGTTGCIFPPLPCTDEEL